MGPSDSVCDSPNTPASLPLVAHWGSYNWHCLLYLHALVRDRIRYMNGAESSGSTILNSVFNTGFVVSD